MTFGVFVLNRSLRRPVFFVTILILFLLPVGSVEASGGVSYVESNGKEEHNIGYLSVGDKVDYSWDVDNEGDILDFHIINKDTTVTYHPNSDSSGEKSVLVIDFPGDYFLVFENRQDSMVEYSYSYTVTDASSQEDDIDGENEGDLFFIFSMLIPIIAIAFTIAIVILIYRRKKALCNREYYGHRADTASATHLQHPQALHRAPASQPTIIVQHIGEYVAGNRTNIGQYMQDNRTQTTNVSTGDNITISDSVIQRSSIGGGTQQVGVANKAKILARYETILRHVLHDGVIDGGEAQLLAQMRGSDNISMVDHDVVLRKVLGR